MRSYRIIFPFLGMMFLAACGNGQPSKQDAEEIYNTNAARTQIHVTDLRCDPAEHGAFSCFVAYQLFWTKVGEKEAQDFYKKEHRLPPFVLETPAFLEAFGISDDDNVISGGIKLAEREKDIDVPRLLAQTVKDGEPASGIKENNAAFFNKVDGRWETDAFPPSVQERSTELSDLTNTMIDTFANLVRAPAS